MYDWKKMKKFKILIPVYDDWESLSKLLNEISNVISALKDSDFSCIIINDCSTIKAPEIKIPSNISSLKLINMKKNRGHARCIASGIKYLGKKEDFDYLVVMDGDGEDRPEELKALIKKIFTDPNISVVAKRIKRSEGFIFRLLYQIHKIVTIIFTGKNINFGNYICLTKNDVKILSGKTSLWSSFSGSVKKHISKLNFVNSARGLRYFGSSKMPLFKLIIHSLAIIAVFKKTVFLRSTILIVFLSYLSYLSLKIDLISITLLQALLVIFNLLIYVVSLRENEKEFLNSEADVGKVNNYTH